jgi:flagellar basal-body rod protein FlgG
MSSITSTISTGISAIQVRMKAQSTDLANVGTTGYKKTQVLSADLPYQKIETKVDQSGIPGDVNPEVPSGVLLGTGVRIVATQKDFQQGDTNTTNRDKDFMIKGRGFFQIQRPDGSIAYTRDGSFQQDAITGALVTAEGGLVLPELNIPSGATALTVSTDGVVTATVNNVPVSVGTMALADFNNPEGLEPFGQNLFLETLASGEPQIGQPSMAEFGQVIQGALEDSNVNVVESLMELIALQQAYEINIRALEAENDMIKSAVQHL